MREPEVLKLINHPSSILSYIADIGSEGPTAEERSKMEEEERERLAVLQEAEEIRKDKHRKLEEEREKMRQGVREKVSSSSSPHL